ncbi:hypothetical protein PPL_00247 [Heterostelium album PN500]|uniref:Calcineurin-like phosphoesterase domain-containing protein n=1 Tax=Heterostelium pallidum (strain ATCC 26659 / Pp 5 / PN500) TaxID=670386 RepID=D3AVY1_HETP5|nr:hypothetical protein PPL_00247 [Heterostelium album PN500]EFA86454.1 hypothetical protein PPL_00247 [Heterostelium album PN500]|eukprot:XP_020438559.1 hypothetical protein PPL_00247 [Heterostelium album PN500]
MFLLNKLIGKSNDNIDKSEIKRILRYASDLHLERLPSLSSVNGLYDFKKQKDTRYFLAIPGDIGNFEMLEIFLKAVSPVYERVFFVPGNHEFFYHYNGKVFMTMDEINDRLQKICSKFDNVSFLNNGYYQLDEYRIIGSTFWTKIGKEESQRIASSWPDYGCIFIRDDNNPAGKRLVLPKDITMIHEQSVHYIYELLHSTPEGGKNVVLTHHAPLYSDKSKEIYTSNPDHIGSPITNVFQSDQSAWMTEDNKIKIWIFGHTHYCTKFTFNNVLVASNQLGYQSKDIGFQINEHIILDQIN